MAATTTSCPEGSTGQRGVNVTPCNPCVLHRVHMSNYVTPIELNPVLVTPDEILCWVIPCVVQQLRALHKGHHAQAAGQW